MGNNILFCFMTNLSIIKICIRDTHAYIHKNHQTYGTVRNQGYIGNVSKYIWIGDVYNGHGVANEKEQCTIELPLSTNRLCDLVEHLRVQWSTASFPVY